MNFAVLWLFVKVFSAKFLGVLSFWHGKSEQSVKVFSLESFPLYGSSIKRVTEN